MKLRVELGPAELRLRQAKKVSYSGDRIGAGDDPETKFRAGKTGG
jgi:hypothetical protein